MSKTPKLRFKEFSGDWESIKVDKVFPHVRNGFVGTATPYYVEEGIPYLQSNNIRKNKIDKRKIVYINEEFHKKNEKSILKKGDILMVQSGHAGECAVVTEEFENANCHALIVMTPNNNINSTYCSYYINSDIGQRRIYKLITGNTIKHILASEMKEFNIIKPELEEQEKIASFFSLIDEKISLQSEKVEVLKDYKKGMMQKIFSRELRFKDDEGRDYPEWEEKKLESIVSKKKKGKNAIYAESGNILLNNEYMENSSEPLYVENEIDVNEEDILILWDGSQAGKMYTGFTGVLGSTFVAITLDKYNCNRFIHQQLMYNLDKIQLAWREGSGVPHVAKDFIENFKIKVPVLDEQRKIANILYSIDIKIEKEQEKLDSLKQYKKGLLQQMFV
nr:restriction endonuclease subunit S [uncultured Romboutsia sp.]